MKFPKQSSVFLTGEGDAWYQRNKAFIGDPSSIDLEAITEVLSSFKETINAILEIGCSEGSKLRYLCNHFEATGFGLDPSRAAITAGNKLGMESTNFKTFLDVGVASEIPHKDKFFDLVYFSFCLYLVDRDDISRCIAEADRVLRPGGFLAILDFDPAHKIKKEYKHAPGVFSYKESYVHYFTSLGDYYLVSKKSFSHTKDHFDIENQERLSITILYKEAKS